VKGSKKKGKKKKWNFTSGGGYRPKFHLFKIKCSEWPNSFRKSIKQIALCGGEFFIFHLWGVGVSKKDGKILFFSFFFFLNPSLIPVFFGRFFEIFYYYFISPYEFLNCTRYLAKVFEFYTISGQKVVNKVEKEYLCFKVFFFI
jgi:hypothetical protein